MVRAEYGWRCVCGRLVFVWDCCCCGSAPCGLEKSWSDRVAGLRRCAERGVVYIAQKTGQEVIMGGGVAEVRLDQASQSEGGEGEMYGPCSCLWNTSAHTS